MGYSYLYFIIIYIYETYFVPTYSFLFSSYFYRYYVIYYLYKYIYVSCILYSFEEL